MSEPLPHLARTRPAGPDQGLAPGAALHVEVIADLVCPFCYIGDARLNHLRDALALKVNWCVQEIHPEKSPEGETHATWK